MSSKLAIVSLSGGMDSATVLGWACSYYKVKAVGFRYGSKHNQYENKAAEEIAKFYSVDYRLVDFTSVASVLQSNLLKTGGEIPEGHYEAESMRQTVVPGRNLIFSSILAGIAWSENAHVICLGIHAGDHFIYPDCRPEFFRSMNQAVITGTDGTVCMVAPFLQDDKRGILAWGLKNKVPYHLTRTCYKDQPIACGRCGSCQERLAAFAHHNIPDPIEYISRELIPAKERPDYREGHSIPWVQ